MSENSKSWHSKFKMLGAYAAGKGDLDVSQTVEHIREEWDRRKEDFQNCFVRCQNAQDLFDKARAELSLAEQQVEELRIALHDHERMLEEMVTEKDMATELGMEMGHAALDAREELSILKSAAGKVKEAAVNLWVATDCASVNRESYSVNYVVRVADEIASLLSPDSLAKHKLREERIKRLVDLSEERDKRKRDLEEEPNSASKLNEWLRLDDSVINAARELAEGEKGEGA